MPIGNHENNNFIYNISFYYSVSLGFAETIFLRGLNFSYQSAHISVSLIFIRPFDERLLQLQFLQGHLFREIPFCAILHIPIRVILQ